LIPILNNESSLPQSGADAMVTTVSKNDFVKLGVCVSNFDRTQNISKFDLFEMSSTFETINSYIVAIIYNQILDLRK